MPYNLTTAAFFEFSQRLTTDIPNNGWAFTPPPDLTIYSLVGQANPANFDIATHIRNYIALYGTQYLNYYAQVEQVYYFQPQNWLGVLGPIGAAIGNGYELTENNLNVTTTLDLNIFNLPEGVYFCQLRFKGRAWTGVFLELLEVVNYMIRVEKLPADGIYLEPAAEIEFSHIIGEALPATQQRSLITVGQFTVVVDKHIILSGLNITLVSTVDGVKTYSGENSQTVNFGLQSTIEDEENTYPYYFAEAVFTKNTGGNSVAQAIKVNVYDFSQRNVEPGSLSFFAIKNILEAPPQEIRLEGFGAWSMTGPSWMLFSGATTGTDSHHKNVKPIDSANLAEGVYTGQITIVFGPETFFIPVQHIVSHHISTGFVPAAINFTRDRNGITDIYGNDNYVAEIATSTEVYGFNLFTETKIGAFKKGLFNNRTDFFLGNIVEKTMPRLKNLADVDLESLTFGLTLSFPNQVHKYFNPSRTTFGLILRDRDTQAVVIGREYSFIKFINGRRPSRVLTRSGIIDVNDIPRRVTKNSQTLLNIFRDFPSRKVYIYRNGNLYTTLNPDRGVHELFALRFGFANFSPGDIIQARIPRGPKEGGLYFSQDYLVHPEGKHSYHIVWLNEHGLLDMMEFTGDFTFSGKHKGVVAITFERYLEVLVKYDNLRELSFSANTGFILKSNQALVEGLASSKAAWVVFEDSRPPIALIPNDYKMTLEDSSQMLYAYEVDFTINPDHELKNYTSGF